MADSRNKTKKSISFQESVLQKFHLGTISQVFQRKRRDVFTYIDHNPLRSFFISLAILFVLIFVASFIKPHSITIQKNQSTKSVSTYQIGQTPKVTMQAKIEKTNVITITALMGGVVSSIGVQEGNQVYPGSNLVQLSSNYQGGNAPAIQSQLAQAQYKNVQDTYDIQKDIIAKQRDIANKSKENADAQRDIANQSKNDTQSLLDLDNTILNSINANLDTLQSTNVGGVNDAAILQTQQLKSQYQAAVLQLNASQRNLALQADENKSPAQLATLQRDLAQRQLDIQEKALILTKETSLLQLHLAEVQEATMHPVSPISGVIQKVFVRVGEAVNPGSPLFSIAGNKGTVKATIYLPREMAQQVSILEPSLLHLDGKTIEARPLFVSTEAIQNGLYAVIFTIPEDQQTTVTDAGYITIDVPIGKSDTSAAVPFIPLDSITQTQDSAYVFVVKNKKAQSKTVQLGNVVGRFVEVVNGISSGDQIILDRTVINGDPVKTN